MSEYLIDGSKVKMSCKSGRRTVVRRSNPVEVG